MDNGAKPQSLSAYARHRKVTPAAVTKAINTGRLKDSVVLVEGRRKIGDFSLADAEWAAQSRPRIDQLVKRESGSPGRPDGVDFSEDYGGADLLNLSEARRRSEIEKWLLQQSRRVAQDLENRHRVGELVEIEDVQFEMSQMLSLVKNRVMGAATRIRQTIPGITDSQAIAIDSILRRALKDTADGK